MPERFLGVAKSEAAAKASALEAANNRLAAVQKAQQAPQAALA
jgi:hypothetical protein